MFIATSNTIQKIKIKKKHTLTGLVLMASLIVCFSSSFGITKEKHHATPRDLGPVYKEVGDPRQVR